MVVPVPVVVVPALVLVVSALVAELELVVGPVLSPPVLPVALVLAPVLPEVVPELVAPSVVPGPGVQARMSSASVRDEGVFEGMAPPDNPPARTSQAAAAPRRTAPGASVQMLIDCGIREGMIGSARGALHAEVVGQADRRIDPAQPRGVRADRCGSA